MGEVDKARAWLHEHEQQGSGADTEGEGEVGEYKDLARRALQRERAAFHGMVEEEASLLSASFLRQLQPQPSVGGLGLAPGAREEHGPETEQQQDDEELWLDRRQRRARENERVVRRLFEQQRKVRTDGRTRGVITPQVQCRLGPGLTVS